MLGILNSFVMAVHGWNQSKLALYAAFVSPLLPTSIAFTSWLGQRYGQVYVLLTCLPLLGTASALLLLAPWSESVIIVAFAFGYMGLPFYPAYIAFMSKYYPHKELSQSIGSVETSFTVALVIAYPTFSYIFDSSSRGWDAATPLLIGNACSLTGVAMMIWLVYSVRGELERQDEQTRRASSSRSRSCTEESDATVRSRSTTATSTSPTASPTSPPTNASKLPAPACLSSPPLYSPGAVGAVRV